MTNFHHTDRVQAVVFDWAGTIVDFGSRAPMGAFVQLFKDFGIDMTANRQTTVPPLPINQNKPGKK